LEFSTLILALACSIYFKIDNWLTKDCALAFTKSLSRLSAGIAIAPQADATNG